MRGAAGRAAEVLPLVGAAHDDDNDAAAMDLSADGDSLAAPGDDAASTHVLGSQTDDMIANLYRKHPGMSMSLLEDIFRISRAGPATAPSAAHFLRRIDELPGIPCD